MAKRPIFVPKLSGDLMVVATPVEFFWYPGMSISQKQKSIRSLHGAATRERGIDNILEISSKSETELGVKLSAFNLLMTSVNGSNASVEALFQGSKVFTGGGPYTDIYDKTSKEAKRDERISGSGSLVAFRYGDFEWPIAPQTVFYDWLYISALQENRELSAELLRYDAFSDIEFNPAKSINCQAAAAALYKALAEKQLLKLAMSSPSEFIRIHKTQKTKVVPVQVDLF
jgi:hypothetical protein